MRSLQQLREAFDPGVMRRGELYAKLGKVRSVLFSQGTLTGRIVGAEEYTSRIGFDGQTIRYSCSCPFVMKHGEPCKHLWATLLAAEKRGFLTQMFGGNGSGEKRGWRRDWESLRDRLRRAAASAPAEEAAATWPVDRQLVYALDVDREYRTEIPVFVFTRRRKSAGDWEKPKRFAYTVDQWLAYPEEQDRLIALTLTSGTFEAGAGHEHFASINVERDLIRRLLMTGRCYARASQELRLQAPLGWDDTAGSFEFAAELGREEHESLWRLRLFLRRGEERVPLDRVELLGRSYVVIDKTRVASCTARLNLETLVEYQRLAERLKVPDTSATDLIVEWHQTAHAPPLDVPEGVGPTRTTPACTPHLHVRVAERDDVPNNWKDQLLAQLSFDYEGLSVAEGAQGRAVYDADRQVLVLRDMAAERHHRATLERIGFRPIPDTTEQDQRARLIHSTHFPPAAMELIHAGWKVHGEGVRYRAPGSFEIDVSSGIDWFDVTIKADFGGQKASMPALLHALRQKSRVVTLDDGTVGVLPEEWLEQYAAIAGLGGEKQGDTLRVARSQGGWLDAMLSTLPSVSYDESFGRLREELRGFEKIEPIEPPSTFIGTLRPYQKLGLGWMDFLRRCRIGGCLADDMGLGKTVQVLAMLEERRAAAEGPSLVVVPKSLMFNWVEEARRFTPNIRVLDQTGTDRAKDASAFKNFDLILTTYGTLQRDIGYLRDYEFDYVILDESQAIKNSATANSKTVRLLRGRHRLAMSGTPIENRVAELWSLLEFLNPGMLGAASVFKEISGNGSAVAPQVREVIARAVRPFILRRTKKQVATDLPEKTELTIHCELEPKHRQLYDELRAHYRASLLGEVDRVGLGRAKIQILEALLRLRQAACHPGLVNPEHRDMPAAKIETLLDQLREVTAEGHKALVFSQFVSFLDIVRARLGTEITYEYLDGQTRDRQARVERFQNDPDCKLFLISLKAGGVGLNLTAAEYVYLLDPWWNPAVEAQAIDRTHRIGQTQNVFAYRLIAKDTVEEKVLKLQQTKRELADAIINGDAGVMSTLRKEDLELLLS